MERIHYWTIDFNSTYICDIFMQTQVVPQQARLGFFYYSNIL